jgi:hypothetical protein
MPLFFLALFPFQKIKALCALPSFLFFSLKGAESSVELGKFS